MSITDYVIDILLILVIFRQVRPHELSPRAALLPLALLILAGIVYLRPFTVRGNDLALIVILAAAGIVLGGLSGLADSIWRDGRRLMFRAGAGSVITWVAGMGFRFGFAFYAYHGGAASVASFSARHDITGASMDNRAGADGPRPGAGPAGRPAGRRIRAISQSAASRQVPANQRERDASRRP